MKMINFIDIFNIFYYLEFYLISWSAILFSKKFAKIVFFSMLSSTIVNNLSFEVSNGLIALWKEQRLVLYMFFEIFWNSCSFSKISQKTIYGSLNKSKLAKLFFQALYFFLKKTKFKWKQFCIFKTLENILASSCSNVSCLFSYKKLEFS